MAWFARSFFFTVILFLTSLAQAGFHFEPYLGQSLNGTWKEGASTDDVSMTEFGFKMGYQAPVGIQVGGELQMGVVNDKKLIGGTTNDKAGQAAFGIYLGYQSPIGLRFYAHYLFASALVYDDTFNTDYGGRGYKLGAGYSLLSWLALNLEYHMMTYDKYKNDVVSSFTTLSPEHKDNVLLLVLSFPFNFGGGSNDSGRSSMRR